MWTLKAQRWSLSKTAVRFFWPSLHRGRAEATLPESGSSWEDLPPVWLSRVVPSSPALCDQRAPEGTVPRGPPGPIHGEIHAHVLVDLECDRRATHRDTGRRSRNLVLPSGSGDNAIVAVLSVTDLEMHAVRTLVLEGGSRYGGAALVRDQADNGACVALRESGQAQANHRARNTCDPFEVFFHVNCAEHGALAGKILTDLV